MEEVQEIDKSAAEGDVVPATGTAPADDFDFGEGFVMREGWLEEVLGILATEEDGSKSPSSVLCVSPFVTINGNEESCGPSFSDTSTTVMASLDIGGCCIPHLMGLLSASENVLSAGVFSVAESGSGTVLAVEAATEGSSAALKLGLEGSPSPTSEFTGSVDVLVSDAESDDAWLARVLGSTV